MSKSETVVQVYKLDRDAYEELESIFSRPYVTNDTTDIQAGYQLGVQAVLNKIREGIPVERITVSS